MGSYNIIVREYLESLKEDKELDYLFPILLNLMGFKLIATAKESKGQPQYGKDIIAVGKDEDGIKKRFYFELKGYSDKNIDQTVFLKPDGIRESILEAKVANFDDSSIPGFNDLPIQIVIVHNGILKSNTRKTFEDFITKEFPSGGFERWDIYKLTDLFSSYLFDEYLFTDEQSVRLFKRTLVLLDGPDYDFSDFRQLVDLQVEKTFNVESRAFKKFFATINLLSVIVIHYSKESNNLYPARECVTYLILSVWAWILRTGLNGKNAVLKEFRKLLQIHYKLLDEYFRKTRLAVEQKDGLFSSAGQMFEMVGYPIRCFDYLNYLIYFFEARHYFPAFEKEPKRIKREKLVQYQVNYLITFLNNNSGCSRPLLDNHSIAIINTVLFLLRHEKFVPENLKSVESFLSNILNNIIIIKNTRGRFPELHNNVELLTEYIAKNKRPHFYEDRSSLLITYIFEILALINAEEVYNDYRESFEESINLQMAYIDLPTSELEILLFTQSLYQEMHVEVDIKLPTAFKEFRERVLSRKVNQHKYETDKAGFGFLRHLAHSFFKNEFFVEEWVELPLNNFSTQVEVPSN